MDRVKSAAKFDFSLPKALKEAGAGYAAAAQFGVPGLELLGAAAGAVSSVIKFEEKLGSAPSRIPPRSQAFAALYYVEQEFPGTLPR